MKISEVLREKERGISLEFFPPKTEEARGSLKKAVNELKELSPLYASVTYGAGGTTQDRTKDTLYMLKRETPLNLMSHLTCIGATREKLGALLDEYREHGIDNILALRGDLPEGTPPEAVLASDFRYAKDLVSFVKGYGCFSVAVAVYPECHQESASIEKDIEYTKMKVDAGADFAITQMFFDNSLFYEYMDRAIQKGITIPILPGIMPLANYGKVKRFAAFCGASIPESLDRELSAVEEKDAWEKGIELSVRQCKDLLANGVKYLHFYTLNRSEETKAILWGLGVQPA